MRITKQQQIKDLQQKLTEAYNKNAKLFMLSEKYRKQAIDLEKLLQEQGEERSALLKYEAAMNDLRSMEEEKKKVEIGYQQVEKAVGGLIGAALNIGTKVEHQEVIISRELAKSIIDTYKISGESDDKAFKLIYESCSEA